MHAQTPSHRLAPAPATLAPKPLHTLTNNPATAHAAASYAGARHRCILAPTTPATALAAHPLRRRATSLHPRIDNPGHRSRRTPATPARDVATSSHRQSRPPLTPQPATLVSDIAAYSRQYPAAAWPRLQLRRPRNRYILAPPTQPPLTPHARYAGARHRCILASIPIHRLAPPPATRAPEPLHARTNTPAAAHAARPLRRRATSLHPRVQARQPLGPGSSASCAAAGTATSSHQQPGRRSHRTPASPTRDIAAFSLTPVHRRWRICN
jgi:hypothetical protein